MIVWGRGRAASAYGIVWGDAEQNKYGGILCGIGHSVDSSGDSKVLTELQIAIRSKLLFYTIKSQEN